MKTVLYSFLPPVVCRRSLCLIYLIRVCLRIVVSSPTHIVLCFFLVCLRLEYLMLPVSMNCPFVIVPSVFSNVYLLC